MLAQRTTPAPAAATSPTLASGQDAKQLANKTAAPPTSRSPDGSRRERDQESESVVRFRTSLRNTVCDVMRSRGWKETESETDWDFFWCDVHWLHEFYDSLYLHENQKINHYKNHYELTRKDLLVKNVKRMMKDVAKAHGKEAALRYDFISTSFVLPQEHAMFAEEFKRNPKSVWIMKPVGRAQGRGIFLINKVSQVSGWKRDPKPAARLENGEQPEGPEAYIVQRYIERPYLIGGKKFDIRLYALVTSWNPLRVYVHRHAFCRFSNSQFSMDAKDISNLYIHATNVAVQKTSPHYDSSKGCKWLIRNLKMYLASKHGQEPVRTLFNSMEEIMVRALLSVQKIMINDRHCFELYGYDILIDQDLKPWMLEVNASPSLTAETQWDYDLKYWLLHDVFDLVDLEKRYTGEKIRKQVGGFDLVYDDGPVKRDRATIYETFLGAHHPVRPSPRKFGRKKKPPLAADEVDASALALDALSLPSTNHVV